MKLERKHVVELRELGYSFHDIAEAVKVPTPVIAQLGLYGKNPDMPIEADVEALLKAKKKPSTEVLEASGNELQPKEEVESENEPPAEIVAEVEVEEKRRGRPRKENIE